MFFSIFIKKIIFIFLIIFSKKLNAKPLTPVISNITKLGFTTVELEWNVPFNDSIYTLYRYHIQLDDGTVKDWPAQFNEEEILNGNVNINITENVTSIFKCQNQCIENINCEFYGVVRNNYNNYDCLLLKNDNEIQTTTSFDKNKNKDNKNEIYGSIKKYDNKTIINNLPYNRNYKFRVRLYDSNLEWSDFSEWSQMINITLDLKIEISRSTKTDLEISWKESPDFDISRIKLIAYKNDSIFFQKNFETYTYTASKYPKLDNSEYVSDATIQKNTLECFNDCKNKLDTVYFVYYENPVIDKYLLSTKISNGTCYCKKKFDIYNSILKYDEAKVYSISVKNSADNKINSVELNNVYRITLICTLPDGSIYQSNNVTYEITDLKPKLDIITNTQKYERILNWNIRENIEILRIKILIQQNNERDEIFYKNNTFDYEEISETISVTSFELCYDSCFNRLDCLAISYFKNDCKIKKSISKKVLCPPNTICTDMIKNINNISLENFKFNTNYKYSMKLIAKNAIIGELAESSLINSVFNTSILKLDEFNDNEPGSLFCYHSVIDENLIKIKWTRNDVEITPNNLNATLLDNNKILYFESYNSNYNGYYSCEVIINKQTIKSKSLYLETEKITPIDNKLTIISSVLGVVIFILLVVLISIVVYFKRKKPERRLPTNVPIDHTSQSYGDIETINSATTQFQIESQLNYLNPVNENKNTNNGQSEYVNFHGNKHSQINTSDYGKNSFSQNRQIINLNEIHSKVSKKKSNPNENYYSSPTDLN